MNDADGRQSVIWPELSPEELMRIVHTMYRVHKLLSSITDLDTLLERIMQEGQSIADAEAGSLMLYDPEKDELYFKVVLSDKGDIRTLKQDVRLKISEGIAGEAARTRQSVNVENVQGDNRFFRQADAVSRFHSRSILAVPLLDKDELVGVLEVLNKHSGKGFTEADQYIMEMFANISASVIVNARLIQERMRTERLVAMGEAVAGLSHDAKNIIAGMEGSLELLEQGIKKEDFHIVKSSWPVLRRCARRLSHFVGNMLDYSKNRSRYCEMCHISDVIGEVQSIFSELFTRRNIQIYTEIEPDDLSVWCDGDGLIRCLLNLVINAAEALPPDGGSIWIRAREDRQGGVFISVEDNGEGLSEEQCQKLFELFYSTKGSQGTGLGLAVTAKIIKEHGGIIEVFPRDGGGTRFQIWLPSKSEEGNLIE